MILLPIAFNLLGVYVAKHFLDNLEELLKPAAAAGAGGNSYGTRKKQQSSLFPLKMYFL